MKTNKKRGKKKYKDTYADVLHHIIDAHQDGSFQGNQFYHAMDKVKVIIKESKK